MGSLPMRERGLKLTDDNMIIFNPKVAPHAGAWIEIPCVASYIWRRTVAPHAGAWIEILEIEKKHYLFHVAPHAGAWIEIHLAI